MNQMKLTVALLFLIPAIIELMRGVADGFGLVIFFILGTIFIAVMLLLMILS
jgi:hypothetical protein